MITEIPLTRCRVQRAALFLAASITLLLLASTTRSVAAELYTFRDTLRTESPELSSADYQPKAWPSDEKATVSGMLREMEQDPLGIAILRAAAAEGSISIYYVQVPKPALARGNYRRLMLSSDAIYKSGTPVWRRYYYRIIVHELVHAARRASKQFDADEWARFVEPRLASLEAFLQPLGLTPITAAQMQLSPERDVMERKIRDATGLPSAYCGRGPEEAIAEIVSHLIDTETHYDAPRDIRDILRGIFSP